VSGGNYLAMLHFGLLVKAINWKILKKMRVNSVLEKILIHRAFWKIRMHGVLRKTRIYYGFI
jgi:hypothetical protein